MMISLGSGMHADSMAIMIAIPARPREEMPQMIKAASAERRVEIIDALQSHIPAEACNNNLVFSKVIR